MSLVAHKETGEYRFPLLLLSLFGTLLIPPYFEGHELFALIWKLIFTTVLISAVYVIVEQKRIWLFAMILMLPTLATLWVDHFSGHNRIAFYVDNLTTIAFLGFISYHLLRIILLSKNVNANIIYASMCLYLLIGLIWAAIFSNINLFYDGAFLFNSASSLKVEEQMMGVFTYYSFVTLSTLGYGDIVPTHKVAQSWAAVEAMIGQFYIAIIMARLVSLHATAHPRNKP
ncbi:ion channel [Simiduia curdlanivorans]|uniref:Ion channel n=1 Tax=Simiduia curdlanivorans TaxID=1492769 RepID=A0ABV8V9Y5_9GAMM|nr:potassium channel family protein [Simiduia curdlanivorans]MDN3638859.1 ion channel [Simiduia curdlanivorans]